MSSLKEIRELLVSQASITTILPTSLLLNTFQNTFSRENGSPAPSMSAFEVQDFQKRKLKVIKRSQLHIFRALVLLAGLWVLKEALKLRQNRSNWLRNKYTRWNLLCISLLILSFPNTAFRTVCVLLKDDCSFINFLLVKLSDSSSHLFGFRFQLCRPWMLHLQHQ